MIITIIIIIIIIALLMRHALLQCGAVCRGVGQQ